MQNSIQALNRTINRSRTWRKCSPKLHFGQKYCIWSHGIANQVQSSQLFKFWNNYNSYEMWNKSTIALKFLTSQHYQQHKICSERIEWNSPTGTSLTTGWINMTLIKGEMSIRIFSNSVLTNIFINIRSGVKIGYSRPLLLSGISPTKGQYFFPYNMRNMTVIIFKLSISQCFIRPEIWW